MKTKWIFIVLGVYLFYTYLQSRVKFKLNTPESILAALGGTSPGAMPSFHKTQSTNPAAPQD